MTERGIYIVLAAFALGGCKDFCIESPDDQKLWPTTREVSVEVKKWGVILPKLVRATEGRGQLSLVCTGSYEVTKKGLGKCMRKGRNKLTVGFFPGIYSLSDSADGTRYLRWPAAAGIALVMNVAAGVPTLLSLFYEPFDSYHDSGQGGFSWVKEQGLVGCCKSRRRETWTSYSEEESPPKPHDVTSYALTDFEVSIDGVPYACVAPEKEVWVSFPPEKKVVAVRIVRVPSLPGKLGRFVNKLKGLDFEVEVQ